MISGPLVSIVWVRYGSWVERMEGPILRAHAPETFRYPASGPASALNTMLAMSVKRAITFARDACNSYVTAMPIVCRDTMLIGILVLMPRARLYAVSVFSVAAPTG